MSAGQRTGIQMTLAPATGMRNIGDPGSLAAPVPVDRVGVVGPYAIRKEELPYTVPPAPPAEPEHHKSNMVLYALLALGIVLLVVGIFVWINHNKCKTDDDCKKKCKAGKTCHCDSKTKKCVST